MDQGLQNYYNQWSSPWMRLYYRMLWAQLGEINAQDILDFGSGFGWNANHFAQNNRVVAIEPNIEMIKIRKKDQQYRQITGKLEQLKQFGAGSFDVILCHNVFEYCPGERGEILAEFARLVKEDGFISIVKHNHSGAIMQKVAFENALDQALEMIQKADKYNEAFGKINYYTLPVLIEDLPLQISQTLGLRTFWALQPNEYKSEEGWAEKMFAIEWEVQKIDEFQHLSFFNHLLLKKTV